MPAEQIFGPGGMGPLEFVADLVKSLAWPALIGLGFVLYRRQLRGFLVSAAIAVRRLNRFKYGDFEAGVAAQQAAQQAAMAPAVTAIEKSIEAVVETISSEKPPEQAKEDALTQLDYAARSLEAFHTNHLLAAVSSGRWRELGEGTPLIVGDALRRSRIARPGSVVTRAQLASLLRLTNFLTLAEKGGLELAIHRLEQQLQDERGLAWSPGVRAAAQFLKRAGVLDKGGRFTNDGKVELLIVYGEMILDDQSSGKVGEGRRAPDSNIGHHDEEDSEGPAPGDTQAP